MALGVSYNEFWHMNPAIVNVYIEADKNISKKKDRENWYQGQYFLLALNCALDSAFNGKKAKCKYIEKPFLYDENEGLTQEEIDDRELQKMLFYEEQWIKGDKAKGLQEADI